MFPVDNHYLSHDFSPSIGYTISNLISGGTKLEFDEQTFYYRRNKIHRRK